MSGFTIPNTPDPVVVNQNQAEPDSLDFQIIGNQKNGIVSGMTVSPGDGQTVTVDSGEVLINGVHYTFGGDTSLELTAYVSTNFFDVVYARVDAGAITCHVAPGTGGLGNPRYPSSGSGSGQINFDTDVVLAAIWRSGSVAPTTNEIVDKRVFVRSNASRTNADTISSNRGSTGDIHVNSAWSSSSTLASPLSVKVGSTWYNLARYDASNNFTAGTVTATTFVGNLTGNVTGNLTGDVTGNVYGNLSGNTVTVTGGLYGPSSGVIYPNSTGWSVSTYIDTPIVYTNYVSAGDGDQNNPTYRFGQDTNTGMYHLASDGFGSSSRIRFTVNGSYVYSISSSGGANASSLRYKENVRPATINLENLLNIELVSFNMKGSTEDITGVIAEQLHSMNNCSQFVIYDNEGRPDAVAYDRLAVAYIALLKDHEARLKALEEV